MVMLFRELSSIREVIPFPKTQKGSCLLTNAPGRVSSEQLSELRIELQEDSQEAIP